MDRHLYDRLQYLGKYLRPHRQVLFFSLVLSIISTALGMIQPYFAKLLIDKVFVDSNADLLVPLIVALVVLLSFSFILRTGNNWIYTRFSAGLLFKMREDLFEHLHRVPLRFFSKWKSGDIYSRIASDMADIQGLITETLPNYLFDFLTCAITTAILFWLNWKMVLMSYCFIPVALILMHLIRPKVIRLSREITEGNADISHFLFESLGATKIIRAFDADRLENEKLQKKQAGILDRLLDFQIIGAWSSAVPTTFIIVNSVIIFGYGGVQVLDGAMSLGSLMAFSIYQGRVLSPLQGLMNGFLALQQAKVSLARVEEILEIRPDDGDSGDIVIRDEELRGEIDFQSVSFAYEKGEPVLQGVSFQFPYGRTTALVGPSGAGKSTICDLTMRLFDPDAGVIMFDGIDLKTLKKEWLRKQIALISQDTHLFHTSILENIRFSNPSASDSAVMDAARDACIYDFIKSLPNGFHTEVGDRGVRLSGGQRKRVSIARSLLVKPRVLIMDEATAYLDTQAEKALKETLQRLMAGKTIIVISHRMSTIRGADKIIAIDKTGIQYDGTPRAFLKSNNETLWGEVHLDDRRAHEH